MVVGFELAVGCCSFVGNMVLFKALTARGMDLQRASTFPSLVHSLITLCLAVSSTLPILSSPSLLNTMTASSLLFEPDDLHLFPLLGAFSIGYMAYDLTQILLFSRHATRQLGTTLAHHTLVIAANLFCHLFSFARPIIMLAYTEELSTIFLNIPSIADLDSSGGPAYHICKLLFVVTFVAARFSTMWLVILNIPRLWGEMNAIVVDSGPSFASAPFAFVGLSLVLIMMRVVNIYWLSMIVRKVARSKKHAYQ